MKKFLIIVILCFVPLSVLLIGCVHKHEHEAVSVSKWGCSETHHWHHCLGCDKKLSLSEHDFVDIIDKDTDSTCILKGKDYKKCSVCNYETYTEKPLSQDHSFINGICSLCEQEESSYVKKEGWNNIFIGEYLNNVTLDQNMYLYSKTPENGTNPLIKSETTRYSLCSANATMIRTSSKGVKTTVYHIKQNSVWYAVAMVNNQWYGIIETETESKAGSFQNNIGLDFVNKYNTFSYDSINKCFVANNLVINGETAEFVKVYIENEKLAKIEYKVNSTYQYTISTIEFSNHGTTVVDVPEFTIAG